MNHILKLKHWFVAIAIVLGFLMLPATTQAEPAIAAPHGYHPHHPHYYYHGYWGGIPYGWGYYDTYYGGIGIDLNASGFSYYPWGNYQPYYSTFAAISYSIKEDKGAFTYGQTTRDDAVSYANKLCGAADCGTVVWVQGGCAAFATSASTKRVGWSYADTKYRAIQQAEKSCRSGGNPTDCISRAWVCSF